MRRTSHLLTKRNLARTNATTFHYYADWMSEDDKKFVDVVKFFCYIVCFHAAAGMNVATIYTVLIELGFDKAASFVASIVS